MPYKEFEGKTIEKAVNFACTELNIQKDDLKYNVISKGSKSIFGLVSIKKAKIKVDITHINGDMNQESDSAKSLVDMAFSNSEYDEQEQVKKPERPVKVKETVEEIVEIPEEIITFGKEALQNIIDLITDEATVKFEVENNTIMYEVKGGNSAILIGKRGQNLEAMQYLVEKMINKKSDFRIRIQIDIEGYLESRKESLRNLALKLAEKAKKYGKPMTINQMTAHDRRIVHLTLKDDRSVRTQSMGDGYYRRLVIFPKRSKFKKQSQNKKKA